MLLLNTLVAACTGGTSDPVRNHEEKQSEELAAPAATSGPSSTQPTRAALTTQVSGEIEKLAAMDGDGLFTAGETTFLDFKNWENTSISETPAFQSFIHKFQKQAVTGFSGLNKKAYVSFYFNFCDADLTGCRHLRALKSSPYASVFLARLAEGETDFQSRLRLILLSLETSNQIPNESASILLLKDLKTIRADLLMAKKTALLQQIETYVQMIYNNAHSGRLKISDEMLGSSLDLLQTGEDSQLELAGKLYVKNGKDTATIEDRIKSLNATPTSYAKKMDWLEKNAPHFVTQLKVKKIDSDAYFFVLEQILQRNWTSKQAAAFFKGSGLTLETLNERAKIYASNVVAYIIATIQADLFQGFKKEGKDKDNYFYDGTLAIAPRLVEARALVDQFKSLLSLEDILGGVKNSGLRKIIESLPETFHLAVTDTVTLSLLNQGLKLNVDDHAKIPLLGNPWSGYINTAYIFSEFFGGKMQPLIQVLPIAPSRNYFTTNEAFEFAIRTNFFGTEPEAADEALTRFVNMYLQLDVYRPYGDVKIAEMQTRLGLLKKAVDRFRGLNSNMFYRYVNQQCETIDTKGIRGSLDLVELAMSPTLGSRMGLLKSVGETNDETPGSGATGRKTFAIFPANSTDTNSLEWARLDLVPRFEQLLAVSKAVEANTNLRFPKFQKAVAEYKALVAEAYKEQTQQITEFLPCWYKIMNEDRRVTSEIVKYENRFWQWALRPENRNKVQEIFSKDLPPLMKFRSKIENNTAVLYNFDLLIRSRYYLLYGLPFINNPLPPISPEMKIQIVEGAAKTTLYKSSRMTDVTIDENLELTAINITRAAGFKPANAAVFWYQDSYLQTVLFTDLMGVIGTLHRMGPVAKEFLGLDPVYKTTDLFRENLGIFKFLNLSKNEEDALSILGEPQRIRTPRQLEAPFLLEEDGSLIPVTQHLNKAMIAAWTSDFASAALWENPGDNGGLSRPVSLISTLNLGRSYMGYLEERNSSLSHLFKDNLTATKPIAETVHRLITEDITVRRETLDGFKSQQPFTLHMKIGENVILPGQNQFFVDDLKASLDDMQKYVPTP